MFDFTLTSYRSLIYSLVRERYTFQTFEEFMTKPGKNVIILRHDVDSLPGNSLQFARIQAEMGIRGTFYFRIMAQSFNDQIINEIYSLEHEIGYHYEDVSLAAVRRQRVTGNEMRGRRGEKEKGSKKYEVGSKEYEDYEKYLTDIAIDSFKVNLEKLRKIVPVKTICMHGSPMGRWDSRLLWKYYDYHDFGIIGEPYFDLNFDEMLYLTDTGRRWDGDSYNIRDKAQGAGLRAQGAGAHRDGETKRRRDEEAKGRRDMSLSPSVPLSLSLSSQRFHSTFDISGLLKKENFLTK